MRPCLARRPETAPSADRECLSVSTPSESAPSLVAIDGLSPRTATWPARWPRRARKVGGGVLAVLLTAMPGPPHLSADPVPVEPARSADAAPQSASPAAPESVVTLARYEAAGVRMGVMVKLVVYASDDATARTALEAGLARMSVLTERMSDYLETSEVSRLTRGAIGEPVAVSEDVMIVLLAAHNWTARSEGAFDVTVGPLTTLWRAARTSRSLPPEADREAALAAVGMNKLRLDADASTATPLVSGLRLDLGGIAKGYIVDQTLQAITEAGVTSALVEAGGDLAVSGPPPGKPGWTVEIEHLDPTSRSPGDQTTPEPEKSPHRAEICLTHAAVASSGDAFQFVEIEGRRYSHLVDPRTGWALSTPRAVTVVAPDCMTADVLASAISVQGPKQADRLVGFVPTTAALVVEATDPADRSGGTVTTQHGDPSRWAPCGPRR